MLCILDAGELPPVSQYYWILKSPSEPYVKHIRQICAALSYTGSNTDCEVQVVPRTVRRPCVCAACTVPPCCVYALNVPCTTVCVRYTMLCVCAACGVKIVMPRDGNTVRAVLANHRATPSLIRNVVGKPYLSWSGFQFSSEAWCTITFWRISVGNRKIYSASGDELMRMGRCT